MTGPVVRCVIRVILFTTELSVWLPVQRTSNDSIQTLVNSVPSTQVSMRTAKNVTLAGRHATLVFRQKCSKAQPVKSHVTPDTQMTEIASVKLAILSLTWQIVSSVRAPPSAQVVQQTITFRPQTNAHSARRRCLFVSLVTMRTTV